MERGGGVVAREKRERERELWSTCVVGGYLTLEIKNPKKHEIIFISPSFSPSKQFCELLHVLSNPLSDTLSNKTMLFCMYMLKNQIF